MNEDVGSGDDWMTSHCRGTTSMRAEALNASEEHHFTQFEGIYNIHILTIDRNAAASESCNAQAISGCDWFLFLRMSSNG